MHRGLKYTLALGLLFACALARGAETGGGLFWSIERAGEPAGYLLGTVHSEDARVLEFTRGFLDRLGECSVFAMELVPDQVTLSRLATFMNLPDGGHLETLVGTDLFGEVAKALAAYGMPVQQVARLKPWAAMMTLSVPPPQTGLFMDFSLSLRADGLGLEVVGLETLDEQLNFLEAMPMAQQVALLRQSVREFDQVQAVHDQLVDTYLRGDVAALQRMTQEQMVSLDAGIRDYFMAQGIDARNHRMALALLELLADGRVFAAVGALHLTGETGLVSLLRAEGYTLRPLATPFVASPEMP